MKAKRQAWFYKEDIKVGTKITFYPKKGRKTYTLYEVVKMLEWLEIIQAEGGK
jgi:hypothetical protein